MAFFRSVCNARHLVLSIGMVLIFSSYIFITSVIRVHSPHRSSRPRFNPRTEDGLDFQSFIDDDGRTLLTIFTSFHPSPDKRHIHENTIRNWGQMKPYIQPVLLSTGPTYLDDFAKTNGWEIYRTSKVNTNGLPIVKDMFLDIETHFDSVFYCFSNADIMFDYSLLRTLNDLKKYSIHFKKMFIVGRRTNYDMKGEIVKSLRQVSLLGRKGKLFMPDAEDYFISTRHGYPWSRIKEVVIGRPGYDNYLVSMAIKNNVTVVDATNTTLALHQTGSDGNFAGAQRKDEHVNKDLIGPFDYYSGLSTCAQFGTTYDVVGNVYLAVNTNKCTYSKIEL